jgi:hypothetical protein
VLGAIREGREKVNGVVARMPRQIITKEIDWYSI